MPPPRAPRVPAGSCSASNKAKAGHSKSGKSGATAGGGRVTSNARTVLILRRASAILDASAPGAAGAALAGLAAGDAALPGLASATNGIGCGSGQCVAGPAAATGAESPADAAAHLSDFTVRIAALKDQAAHESGGSATSTTPRNDCSTQADQAAAQDHAEEGGTVRGSMAVRAALPAPMSAHSEAAVVMRLRHYASPRCLPAGALDWAFTLVKHYLRVSSVLK
jgi:hypothetical protein